MDPELLELPGGGGYSVSDRLARVEVRVENMADDLAQIARAGGRPSWAVATILALSTAMNGALLTALTIVVTSGPHKL